MFFLAACVALTACKKEVLTKGTPFQEGEIVTISASAGGGSNAKVSGVDAGTSINFTWDEGDEIKVTVGGSSSNFRLSSGKGSCNAEFTGTMPASGNTFNIQYPVNTPDLRYQYQEAGKVPKDKMLFTATNCTIGGEVNLGMAYAILKLHFTGTQRLSQIIVETVGYSSPEKFYVLYCDVTLDGNPTPFLMVVDPMSAKLKVTVYDGNGPITSFTTSNAQNLVAGQCLSMPTKNVSTAPIEDPGCLCFTALQGNSKVSMPSASELNLEYYKYGETVNFMSWNGSEISLQAEEKVYIRVADEYTNSCINRSFSTEGNLKVSGKIMCLVKSNGQFDEGTIDFNCFKNLFKECTITDASELQLPDTYLKTSCFEGMFSDCRSLTAAPALPAENLAPSCYQNMFSGCENLSSVTMRATDVSAENCLYHWLEGAGTNVSGPKYVHVASGMATTIQNTLPPESGWTAIED